jgi:NADH pyrophosphatase NudC (nudix superfamily)
MQLFVSAFVVSFVGLSFVFWSRNVPAKRIVLPTTLAIFSGLLFELYRRAMLLPSNNVLSLLAVALVLNALWVMRRVHYCAQCGRTFQRGLPGDKTHCPACATQLSRR